MLIRKRIWTGEEINTDENQGKTHSKQQISSHCIQLLFLYPGILVSQAHTLNQFPVTTFILPTTTPSAKGIPSAYEILVTSEISMSQKIKG